MTDCGKGKVVVISGPSGSGKTTICKRLADGKDILFSVSATTRAPRQGEVDGADYYFLSKEEFEREIANGEFLEHAEYNGRLYGTPRQNVDEARRKQKILLVEIDVQGARQMRQSCPDATFIFIDTPTAGEARARLERRNTESAADLARRLDTAAREREEAKSIGFDYTVINDDLEEAVGKIEGIISNCRKKEAT